LANKANIQQVNNFVGGLVTEASPLNFPPNASLDEANMVLNQDGTRQRRLGLSFESYAANSALDVSGSYTGQFKGYRWDSVGGDAALSIQVVQMAGCITFFDNTKDTLATNTMGCIDFKVTGNNKFDFTVVNGDLVVATGETNCYVVTYNTITGFSYKMVSLKIRDLFGVEDGTAVNGRPFDLSNTHEYNLRNQGWPNSTYLGGGSYGDPIADYYEQAGRYPSNADQFQYGMAAVKDPSDDEPSEKFKPLEIHGTTPDNSYAPRGHFIIDAFSRGLSRESQVDSTDDNGTPRTALFDVAVTCSFDSNGIVCSSCAYINTNTEYPLNNTLGYVSVSNIEAYNAGGGHLGEPNYTLVKKADGQYVIRLNDPPLCAFGTTDNAVMDRIRVYFTEYASSTVDLSQDKELGRPTTVASMGNRVFYSGIRSNLIDGDKRSVKYTGMVFFSRVADTINDLHQCYQEADPTSRRISDLVDTDGGHINIVESDNILKLIPLGQSLVVISENGVWEIKGGDSGFLATEYIINKISDLGCSNRESIVIVENSIMYWAESSIQNIARNNYGDLVSSNISEEKVRSLITDIDKSIVVGFYDRVKKVVRWMYQNYERELIYDIKLQAYYKNTYPKRWIRGYVDVPEYSITLDYQEIQVGDQGVFVDNYEIIYGFQARGTISSGVKYITVNSIDKILTFSQFDNGDFTDWYGYNYDSYLITGFNTSGDIVSKKTNPYIMFYLTRTEDGFKYNEEGGLVPTSESSCWVQTMWDWSASGSSGKWGAPFQAYRYLRPYIPSGIDDKFNYGENVLVTKNKILGRGRSLAMKIASEDGKDLQLLGWANVQTGTEVP